jgi:aryl-alcohol dehydrogenase-like predicted oxidoreductase
MQYRKFGNTDYKVSEIGFGTWPLAGGQNGAIAYGTVHESDSIKSLQYAHESGINFYDTADFYGYGYVEELLGRCFKDVRKDIIFATKVGLVSDNSDLDFTTDHMVEAIEQSLKRLQTDYIDIYMLHCPKLDILDDGRIEYQ